jgi:hypothetical protein
MDLPCDEAYFCDCHTGIVTFWKCSCDTKVRITRDCWDENM